MHWRASGLEGEYKKLTFHRVMRHLESFWTGEKQLEEPSMLLYAVDRASDQVIHLSHSFDVGTGSV